MTLPKFAFAVALFAAIAALLNSSFAADSTAEVKIRRIELGFKNHFKVGSWTPFRIEIDGAPTSEKQQVEITVGDSDGVPTTASAPLTTAGGDHQSLATVYTKVGRIGSAIQVSLVSDEHRLDEQTLKPDAKERPSSAAVALSATAELIVSFGSAPLGIRDAFPNRESDAGQSARQVVELTRVADLPTDWFGYDAVDVFVISAGNGNLCRELAADKVRYDALARWIELGGRLVMLCDGQTSKELLAPGGPLGRFAPGKLAEVVHLPETGSLEHFANAAAPISIAPGAALRVPRFTDVGGNIEVSGSRKATDLPVVVRSARGFGEIAFAGVDFSRPPLLEWSGRGAFLQALLRPYLATVGPGDTTQRLVTRGYNDLGGALRQQLGQSFASIATIGFAGVAVLAILYIAFLGPLDYLFVNRWLRRPWVAWITFPLIVLGFCGAAMSLAAWRNGGAVPHANRLELVDIDTLAGQARGTLWTTLYSPTAATFNLSAKGPELHTDSTQGKEVLLSWWGLPGNGIGGMQSGGIDLGIVHSGYRYGPDRSSLLGVPVLASATKSLVSRWTSPVSAMIDAKLTDQDGLAVGSITNQTGFQLHNARLLYGSWAYRLGDINVGKRVDVGEQLSPRKVKTIVTHDALGETGTAKGAVEGQVFAPEKASAKEILSLMMFYEAAGGYGFAHLPNRYQAYCDLSRTLELGRAILVADAAGPVADLVDDATGAAVGDRQDESTVVYRFVMPVRQRSGP
jgi:hypothetical protein